MRKNPLIGLCLVLVCMLGCAKAQQPTKTITIWHWMTDRDKAFQDLAQKYEQQTGVKIIFKLYATSDVYSQKIIAAAQDRILPDIFGILDKKSVVAAFIQNGLIADLTPEFQANDGDWEKSLFPKALVVNQFEAGNLHKVKPGIYGVPLDVTNIQMLYNKKLLAKAGVVDVPKTLNEFLEAGERLKLIGVPVFVSGWGELWLADCFASNYAFNIMGETKVMATFRGEVPYTDPDWIKVFSVFKTLTSRGMLINGIVTKSNKNAEQDFAMERAAFAFNGSWCVNIYHDMNPDLEYGAMLPPAVSTDFPMKIWGGAGSSFLVNNNSPNRDDAIAFLRWLTAVEQQAYLSQETRNLPANRNALNTIPQILSEFASTMDSTTHQTVWPLNEDTRVNEAFDKGIQAIIIGEKTPEQVAREVNAVKQKQLEKQRNKDQQ